MAEVSAADVVGALSAKDTHNTTPASTASDNQPTIVAATKSLELDTPSPATAANGAAPTSLQDALVAANETPKHTSIEDLPNELLSQVFGFLDIPRHSTDLHDEPKFELTDAATSSLKASSLVSKRWRQSTLPLLFKYGRFVVPKPEPKMPIRSLNKQIQPFLEFVTKNQLLKIITSFVIVVYDREITGDDDVPEHKLDIFASFWRSLFKTIDPVELLIIAHPVVLGALTSCYVYAADIWNFDCPCHYLRLRRPQIPHNQPVLSGEVAVSPHECPASAEVRKLSEPVATVFSGEIATGDLLKHETTTSIISTESPGGPTDSSSELSPTGSYDTDLEPWEIHPQASTLFGIRPWSSLLLNEGSFIKAYSTYEFWLRQAPSILSDMVGADDQTFGALISPTIREMSYIGIFPMASHFASLTTKLPRLNSLFIQLVPRNNILEVPAKMVQVETADLWMERNTCYSLLMRELFNVPPKDNYKYVEVFESGDAADTDAWNMAVEYVKRTGNGWKVAGDGVLVRDSKDLVPEPEDGAEAADPSLLSVSYAT